VGQKVFAAGARKRRIPSEKQMAVLGPVQDKEMAPLRVHRNALDQAEISRSGYRLHQRPARYPLVGRYFVAGLAFSLRWWKFSIFLFGASAPERQLPAPTPSLWPLSSISQKIFDKKIFTPINPQGGSPSQQITSQTSPLKIFLVPMIFELRVATGH
jgi:hypothetical protein